MDYNYIRGQMLVKWSDPTAAWIVTGIYCAPPKRAASGRLSGRLSNCKILNCFRNSGGAGPLALFLEGYDLAPLVRAAYRADPVGLLGAVTLRAGVDRRTGQAVVGPALVPSRFGSLSFGYGH